MKAAPLALIAPAAAAAGEWDHIRQLRQRGRRRCQPGWTCDIEGCRTVAK